MQRRGEPTDGCTNGAQRGTLLSQSAPSGGNSNKLADKWDPWTLQASLDKGVDGPWHGRSGPCRRQWGASITPKALSLRASFDHAQPISRLYRLTLDRHCQDPPSLYLI